MDASYRSDLHVMGVFVNFFGQKAWISLCLAVLALKTEADIYKRLIYRRIQIQNSG
jgi:lauroyl/myristoyl acyltransferase